MLLTKNTSITNFGDLEHDGFVLKSGDTMSGDLIIPKESYPIRGDLNKVINYDTQRDIF